MFMNRIWGLDYFGILNGGIEFSSAIYIFSKYRWRYVINRNLEKQLADACGKKTRLSASCKLLFKSMLNYVAPSIFQILN